MLVLNYNRGWSEAMMSSQCDDCMAVKGKQVR